MDVAAVKDTVVETVRVGVMDTVVETVRVGVTVRVAVIVARLAPADPRAPRTTTVRSAANKSRVARRSASC
jgi:hypothetical protein